MDLGESVERPDGRVSGLTMPGPLGVALWIGAWSVAVLPIDDVLAPAFVDLPGVARLGLRSPGVVGAVVFVVFLALPLVLFLGAAYAIRRRFPQSPGAIIFALWLLTVGFMKSSGAITTTLGPPVEHSVESLIGWSAAAVFVVFACFAVQASLIRRRQRESA